MRCAADIANDRTVLVGGEVRKQDFRLVADLEGPRQLVLASRDYLVAAVPPQAGWLPRAVEA